MYKPKKMKFSAKKKKHFANYVVFISLCCVICYTISAFILQFLGFYEISSTLTACFFAFFGTELMAMAIIKKEKVKNDKNSDEKTKNFRGV